MDVFLLFFNVRSHLIQRCFSPLAFAYICSAVATSQLACSLFRSIIWTVGLGFSKLYSVVKARRAEQYTLITLFIFSLVLIAAVFCVSIWQGCSWTRLIALSATLQVHQSQIGRAHV